MEIERKGVDLRAHPEEMVSQLYEFLLVNPDTVVTFTRNLTHLRASLNGNGRLMIRIDRSKESTNRTLDIFTLKAFHEKVMKLYHDT